MVEFVLTLEPHVDVEDAEGSTRVPVEDVVLDPEAEFLLVFGILVARALVAALATPESDRRRESELPIAESGSPVVVELHTDSALELVESVALVGLAVHGRNRGEATDFEPVHFVEHRADSAVGLDEVLPGVERSFQCQAGPAGNVRVPGEVPEVHVAVFGHAERVALRLISGQASQPLVVRLVRRSRGLRIVGTHRRHAAQCHHRHEGDGENHASHHKITLPFLALMVEGSVSDRQY